MTIHRIENRRKLVRSGVSVFTFGISVTLQNNSLGGLPLIDDLVRTNIALRSTPLPTHRHRQSCARFATWLLTGPRGGEVIKVTLTNSHPQNVISAIHTLRDRFAEPVRIAELASEARMSPSAFHRQFKASTSMTPLQYQKRLRSREVRRLMVSDAADADTAAFQVGYESPSQ
jgi:AraC-like DNA-binding protein